MRESPCAACILIRWIGVERILVPLHRVEECRLDDEILLFTGRWPVGNGLCFVGRGLHDRGRCARRRVRALAGHDRAGFRGR